MKSYDAKLYGPKIKRVKERLKRFAKKVVKPGTFRDDARIALNHALNETDLADAMINIKQHITWNDLIEWALDRAINPDQFESEHHKWLKRIKPNPDNIKPCG